MAKSSARQRRKSSATNSLNRLDGPTPFEIVGRKGLLKETSQDWATHVAPISTGYVKYVSGESRLEPAKSILKRWQKGPGKVRVRWRTEGYTLLIFREPGGWIAHRQGGDRQTLSTTLGDMPILCPSFAAAAKLAEASNPSPPPHLHWRSD
jgi:hypothetical protein